LDHNELKKFKVEMRALFLPANLKNRFSWKLCCYNLGSHSFRLVFRLFTNVVNIW